MTSAENFIHQTAESRFLKIGIKGDWTMHNAPQLESLLKSISPTRTQYDEVCLHCNGLKTIDTTGAWLIYSKFKDLKSFGFNVSLDGFKEVHFRFIKTVESYSEGSSKRYIKAITFKSAMSNLGHQFFASIDHLSQAFGFLGRVTDTFFRALVNPYKFRIGSIVRHIQEAGINALPIVAVMAFLIAVVLTYQGATQLQKFGAEIFTVNLTAISILREMGVLLTAILVAGRSGSAFAAEIGVMKLNEEVDALKTIGIDPYEILVLPRIIALVIALPLMTFVANICGLVGGGVMSVLLLDIPVDRYLSQLSLAINMQQFLVGMIKAPVFAFIIASVSTFRGMQASGSAESVGEMTTISVVQSIFLVLAADAVFSIIFSELDI